MQDAKLMANLTLKGSFKVETPSTDKSQSPLTNISTDSESVKSTSSLNENQGNLRVSQKVDSHLAAFAKHARRPKDHKAHMEFLD